MPVPLQEAVADFLAQRRIAVAGVSRDGNAPGNLILRKLKQAGHEVFAVNPHAETLDGEPVFRDVRSIPGGVDAVVVTAPPSAAAAIVRECREAGIERVWLHRSFGRGSVDDDAVRFCRDNGIRVIAGGCPMMFCDPVDLPHRCMRFVLRLVGGLPGSA